MPTSLRKRKSMEARRADVRREYNRMTREGMTSAMTVDSLARIGGVSRATIYNDLKATRKEAKR